MAVSYDHASYRYRTGLLRCILRLPEFFSAGLLIPVALLSAMMSSSLYAVDINDPVAIQSIGLCHSQSSVDRLVAEIAGQYRIIEQRRASIATLEDGFDGKAWYQRVFYSFSYLGQWSWRKADMLSRYMTIATLETSLLVAYSKLRAARIAFEMPQDPVAACAAESQLLVALPASAGVSSACRGPQLASCTRAVSRSSSESSTTWVSAEDS